MVDVERPQTNFQRLLDHLSADTLAARLVAAQIDPQGQQTSETLQKVILDRLEEVRRDHEPPSDQDA